MDSVYCAYIYMCGRVPGPLLCTCIIAMYCCIYGYLFHSNSFWTDSCVTQQMYQNIIFSFLSSTAQRGIPTMPACDTEYLRILFAIGPWNSKLTNTSVKIPRDIRMDVSKMGKPLAISNSVEMTYQASNHLNFHMKRASFPCVHNPSPTKQDKASYMLACCIISR